MNICVKNKVNDHDGRFLILEATIDGSDYLLINLYNANTEKEQLTTTKSLNKKVIFAGDFNLIFDKNFKSARGKGEGCVPFSKNIVYPRSLNYTKLLICVIFGGYVIPVRIGSLSDKNISPVLCNEDLIIFSFLTV